MTRQLVCSQEDIRGLRDRKKDIDSWIWVCNDPDVQWEGKAFLKNVCLFGVKTHDNNKEGVRSLDVSTRFSLKNVLLSGKCCSITRAVWHNLYKIKPHKMTLCIFYGLKYVCVKEKFKKMSGRVQSDYLFGGEEVGLWVRGQGRFNLYAVFWFFQEVCCLCT